MHGGHCDWHALCVSFLHIKRSDDCGFWWQSFMLMAMLQRQKLRMHCRRQTVE